MKREKKGKLEYSKGITLIALVITIIVLLILAAVSVSTLTGENGILTKATKAKEDTQKEATREKVQMAVLASYNQNGDVDITILKKELEKIGGTVTDTNEEFPVTVTVDDYTFIIDEKGKVTEGSQGGSEIEEVYTLTEEYLDFDEETGSIALKEAYSYYDWRSGTFQNCELGKTKIKIPATYKGKEVKKIGIISGQGDDAKYQGFGIKDVEEIVLPDKVTAIKGAAFKGCTNLSRIALPDSIESIGPLSFDDCSNLKTINLPSSLIYIGRYAFANNTCLEKITIPSSVRTIDYSVFAGWRETQTIYVPFKETEQPSGWDHQWKEYCSANIVYAQ